MDGMVSKDLFLSKFIFDITTGFPLSFFTSPDPELPNFRTKMKVTPMISDEGNKKANSYRTKDRVYQTTTVGNLTRVNKSGIGLEHRMVITQNHQMCGWRKQVPCQLYGS